MPFMRYRKALFFLLGLLIAASLSIPPNFVTPPQVAQAEPPPPSAPNAPPNPPVFASNCNRTFTHTYNVGPGQTYTSIGAVPFSSLQPNSIVRIHYRADPYREKVFVNTVATSTQPVCIVGVPGPGGALPIIDGENATTSLNMDTHYAGSQTRGVFTIIGADDGLLPAYIYVEGLHIRNGHQSYSFTNRAGAVQAYALNAASVYIQRGEHIRFTGCIITGGANGLFAATDDGENITRDLTVEYSQIYGNGNVGRDREHNTYTESIGMVYQFNYFGPLRSGSGGANLKDRSSGTQVRYNWMDGGSIIVDLVESEFGFPHIGYQPDYHQAWVYGNVIINRPTSVWTVHFGGDNGGDTPTPGTQGCESGDDITECYRRGPLYFYNNTVILYVTSGHKTLFRLQTDEQTAFAVNNILHVGGSGNQISYMAYRGQLSLGVNIVNRGSSTLTNFRLNQGGPNSTVTGQANVNVLTNPALTGFVDANAENYYLVGTSPAVNTGQAIAPPLIAVGYEYHAALGIRVRPVVGAIDMGAFEFGSPVPTDTLALFNPNANAHSRINTLQDLPPAPAYNSYTLAPPAGGQWVMGDWDGNGSKTPGVYANNGVFYTTNATNASATWAATWFGFTNRPPIAGRFGPNANDCIGVIDNGNFPPYGLAFALYFTCNLGGGNPTKTLQWLSVLLPDSQGHTGTHQFAAGDFNLDGVDSISVRRGPTIAWTDVPPTTQLSEFNLAQYIGTPYAAGGYGQLVAGDWDGSGRDSFGLVYQDGAFYRRDDLLWNSGAYLLQRVGQPIGATTTATSWRPGAGGMNNGGETAMVNGDAPPTPSTTLQPTRIEAESEVVSQAGAWVLQEANQASAGQYVYTNDLNGTLTLEFTGTSVEIIYAAGAGSFTVLVDDVAVRTIIAEPNGSPYASTTINYLSDEGHTLQIVPIAGPVAIDAFVVN